MINAYSIISVNVTARDIQYGRTNQCDTCPVARAIKRVAVARHCFKVVRVSRHVVNFNGYVVALPAKAGIFVDNFDNQSPFRLNKVAYRKKHFKPFTFELGVPAGALCQVAA